MYSIRYAFVRYPHFLATTLRITEDTNDTNGTDNIMLHAALSREILACFYCVYNDLGFGFLEGTYRNALSVEFRSRGFDVQHEVPIEVVYRGVPVGRYRLDLVVNNLVLVETKATRCLTDADERQLLNYLKASPNELGLLLHFGPRPAFRRLIYTNDRK